MQFCAECQAELGHPNFQSASSAYLNEDGMLQAKCDKGHKHTSILSNSKHELLSYIAVKALIDGYHREAISSLTSAVERFYEHYIFVIGLANGIEDNELKNSWKLVRNSSERQAGAVAYTSLMEFHRSFVAIPQKQTELRNKVIHKGTIPSRDQVMEYGQAVGQHLKPLFENLLLDKYTKASMQLTNNAMKEKTRMAKTEGFSISTAMIATPFDCSNFQDEFNFQKIVEQFEKMPDIDKAAEFIKQLPNN